MAYLRVVVPPEIEPTDSNSNDVMTSEGSSIKLGCKAKGEIRLFHQRFVLETFKHPQSYMFYLFIALLLIQVIRHPSYAGIVKTERTSLCEQSMGNVFDVILI